MHFKHVNFFITNLKLSKVQGLIKNLCHKHHGLSVCEVATITKALCK